MAAGMVDAVMGSRMLFLLPLVAACAGRASQPHEVCTPLCAGGKVTSAALVSASPERCGVRSSGMPGVQGCGHVGNCDVLKI